MSDTYRKVHDATVDALEQLDRRNYNISPVVYIHPNTWQDVITGLENTFQRLGETQTLLGCEVLRNPNLPENVVMLVNVEQAARSNGAVAFGTIGE